MIRARLVVKCSRGWLPLDSAENCPRLNLVGYVENLPDGTTRIICEGEKENIEKLCNSIRIKNEFVDVEEIEVSFEETRNEFERFEVRISDLGYELFQGLGTAKKYFDNLGKKVDSVGREVRASREDIKGVGEKIDSMHDDMKKVR